MPIAKVVYNSLFLQRKLSEISKQLNNFNHLAGSDMQVYVLIQNAHEEKKILEINLAFRPQKKLITQINWLFCDEPATFYC